MDNLRSLQALTMQVKLNDYRDVANAFTDITYGSAVQKPLSFALSNEIRAIRQNDKVIMVLPGTSDLLSGYTYYNTGSGDIGVGNVCQIYFDAALPNDIQLINNYTVNGFTIEVLVSTDRTYIDLATTGQDLGKVLLVQGENYELITGTNLPNISNVIIIEINITKAQFDFISF